MPYTKIKICTDINVQAKMIQVSRRKHREKIGDKSLQLEVGKCFLNSIQKVQYIRLLNWTPNQDLKFVS